jgi:Cytochrome c7 and related cytochrome c
MKPASTFDRLRILALLIACLAISVVTAPAAQDNACVTCHSSLPGKFGEPVILWKTSIHAGNGVFCHECHGGDPKDMANAMNPSRGFKGVPRETAIPETCGRCHVGVLKDFLGSAHGKRLGNGGPTCVTCHGNHAVKKASLEIINEVNCTKCHPYERARLMKQAMQETEGRITTLDARIQGLKLHGKASEGMEQGLFNARNRFHTLFHNVMVEKVRSESTAITRELDTIGAQIDALEQAEQKRRMAGAAAIGGLLLAALLLRLLGKTYEH